MKKHLIKLNVLFVLVFLMVNKSAAVTRSTASSGDWANASTWMPAGIPGCGDSLIITAGDTVNFTSQQNYSGCAQPLKIVLFGKMWFHNGSKLRMPCGSYIILYPQGTILADQGLGNSNFIEICSVVVWNSNSILSGPTCIPAGSPPCPVILPIEMLNLKAESCKAGGNCLSWQTASEKDNDHFEIERAEDALNFETILSVGSRAPGGNSQFQIYYDAIDRTPLNAINYYRLKSIDRSGLIYYSKIISAEFEATQSLRALFFTDTNNGELVTQITGLQKAGNIDILLVDVAGSIIYEGSHYVNDKSARIGIMPQGEVKRGFYLCSLKTEDSEYRSKLILSGN